MNLFRGQARKAAVFSVAAVPCCVAVIFAIARFAPNTYFANLSPDPVFEALAFAFLMTVVLGHFAVWKSRREFDVIARYVARVGLCFGYLGLAGFLLLPRLDGPRAEPNSTMAFASLRQLDRALNAYAKQSPGHMFPKSLSELSTDSVRERSRDSWIDPTLASGVKGGYRFTYVPRSSVAGGALDSYQIFADPVRPEFPQEYHLFTDETGVIRFSRGGRADSRSASE